MKRIFFFVILLLFAVNTLSCGQLDTLPHDLGKKVSSPKGLKKVIDSQDPKLVIVDVRGESVYYKGHIPTAINIPLDVISEAKNRPPKDKYIILYCNLHPMAEEAGKRMLADGYKYVFFGGWYGRLALQT